MQCLQLKRAAMATIGVGGKGERDKYIEQHVSTWDRSRMDNYIVTRWLWWTAIQLDYGWWRTRVHIDIMLPLPFISDIDVTTCWTFSCPGIMYTQCRADREPPKLPCPFMRISIGRALRFLGRAGDVDLESGLSEECSAGWTSPLILGEWGGAATSLVIPLLRSKPP